MKLFFALLGLGAIVIAVWLVVHDQGVTCHRRIRKSDQCWQQLNQQVKNLQQRVRVLEGK